MEMRSKTHDGCASEEHNKCETELHFGASSVYKYYRDGRNLPISLFFCLHQLKMSIRNARLHLLFSTSVMVLVNFYIYLGF